MRYSDELCQRALELARSVPSYRLGPVYEQLAAEFGIKIRPRSLRDALRKRGLPPLSSVADASTDCGVVADAVPFGHFVKGVSTFIGADGKPKSQWVKTATDAEDRISALREAARALGDELPKPRPVPQSTEALNADLMAAYVMGDPHVGLYAWREENGGHDFDLKIAEQHLCGAVDHLVDGAPPAEQALIVNLGDFFHSDTADNRTMRSGHALDVDTRWAAVLKVGVRVMRRIIDSALRKHARVRVISEVGNHDDHSAVFLAVCLAQFYEREPRVEIDTSPARFHYYRFGQNLIGVTHGDGAKMPQLPGIMAVDRREEWGQTRYHHWYTGHVHHDSRKEFPGCTVESMRTLAAPDAYAHGAGYRSGRDMKCDTWHREWGHVGRSIVGIDQLLVQLAAA